MIGFALCGAGRIGALHAGNIGAHARARLVTVHDTNRASAERLAAATGAETAESALAAIEDPEVDAVLIASSTNSHVALMIAAARAGKPVFCEKPIDLDIAEVNRCRDLIARLNVPVQIGFNRRFDASHAALARAVHDGDVGQLELLLITSRDPSPPTLELMRGAGNLFQETTIHDFDMARFLLKEEPIEVVAFGSVRVDPTIGASGNIDTAMVQMRTADGTLIHINNSFRAVYGYDQRIEAFGSRGMVQSDNARATNLVLYGTDMTAAREPLLHFFVERYEQAYRSELDEFVDVAEGKREPPVTFEDGRRALILADAAWESFKSGRPVSVRFD